MAIETNRLNIENNQSNPAFDVLEINLHGSQEIVNSSVVGRNEGDLIRKFVWKLPGLPGWKQIQET